MKSFLLLQKLFQVAIIASTLHKFQISIIVRRLILKLINKKTPQTLVKRKIDDGFQIYRVKMLQKAKTNG